MGLSVLCWNIGNPSLERARRQAEWLLARTEDVFVLTEAKNSEGCDYLERLFKFYKGYHVVFPRPKGNEYAVMVLSKLPLSVTDTAERIAVLRSRVASVELDGVELVGIYAPTSTSVEPAKVEKKRAFLEAVLNALGGFERPRIFCGDFNVLEPDHSPKHAAYEQWQWFYSRLSEARLVDIFRLKNPGVSEHSWFSREGHGYRFDHCFASSALVKNVLSCTYIHDPRVAGLSDHSAIVAQFDLREDV